MRGSGGDVDGGMRAYVEWMLEWRWPVLAATALLTAVLIAGVGRLTFTGNYRVYFSDDNPQLAKFEELQALYTKQDNLLFVVQPRRGDVFAAPVMAAVLELTESAWRLPYAIRVDSIANHQHTRSRGDELFVASLVPDSAALDGDRMASVRDVALSEPELVDRLVSRDGRTTGVNVTLQMSDSEPRAVGRTMAAARALVEEIRGRHPDLTVVLTGQVPLNHAFLETSQADIGRIVPAMCGMFVGMILLILRSITATFIIVVVIGLSSGVAMGLAGWLGITLSSASVGAPSIILTIAIADGVHLLVWLLGRMRSGLSKREALVDTFQVNAQPVFLTSLTTSIGFLGLNFCDAPPWRDLGNITAMGVGVAWVYSMVLVPVLVSVLPMRAPRSTTANGRAMLALADRVVAHRRGLLWAMTALVVGLAAFIPSLRLNDEFVEYFDEEVEFRRATEFAVDNLTGIYQLEFSLEAGESGGVSEPGYLGRLERFAEWLRSQPGVLHVATFSDVLKRLNRAMHGDDPQWYRLPTSRELAAQYVLLYEMSLPYGLDLTNQLNIDKSATRLSVTTSNLSTQEFHALKDRAESWLRAETPEAMHAEGTGLASMFFSLTERNLSTMLVGTAVAFLLIALCLVVALRSVKFGLLSLVPNVLPPMMAFGLWSAVVGEVGSAAAIVTSTTLGIIVDDTVHFLSKYLRARRDDGRSPEEAVRYAFSTVGPAMWITSVVLVAGFGMMALSPMRFTTTYGLFTMLGIIAALVADFLLLPPLLMALEARAGTRFGSGTREVVLPASRARAA